MNNSKLEQLKYQEEVKARVAQEMQHDWMCKPTHFEISLPIATLTGMTRYFGMKSREIPKPRFRFGILNNIFVSTAIVAYSFVEVTCYMVCVLRYTNKLNKLLGPSYQKLYNTHTETDKQKTPYNNLVADTDEEITESTWYDDKLSTDQEPKLLDVDIQQPFINEVDSPSFDENKENLTDQQQKPVKKYVTYEELRAKHRAKLQDM